MRRIIITTGILLMSHIMVHSQVAAKLKVGDKAPAIKVAKWIKGSPIDLANGKIHFLEFGALFCGPCRASTSTLSRLAEKYPHDISFVSFYIYENGFGITPKDTTDNSYITRVERFVKKMEKEIKFDVAVDDPKQTMVNTWMRPANQNGIPRVFAINRKGEIAWIGSPYDIEWVAEGMINGTFTLLTATERESKRQASFTKIDKSLKDKEPESAVLIIDQLIGAYPSDESLYALKFSILLQFNEPLANEYGRELLNFQCRDIESVLVQLVKDIENNDSKNPDWDLAIDLCNRALELSKYDLISAYILRDQAEAYFHKGNSDAAIRNIEKALFYLDLYESENLEQTRQYFNTCLKRYSKPKEF